MRKHSQTAKTAAWSIMHYLSTRFPVGHDVPPHAIDAEWIADAIQKAIDGDENRKRIDAAGDRRDWNECDRLEGVK